MEVVCPHCGGVNASATCPACGRRWVLGHFDHDEADGLCPFDRAKQAGRSIEAMAAGLRQTTCTSCHTEFVSALR